MLVTYPIIRIQKSIQENSLHCMICWQTTQLSEKDQFKVLYLIHDAIIVQQSHYKVLDGTCMYVARTSTKFSDLFKTSKLDHRRIIGVNQINKRTIGGKSNK